ncbi:hypothetical protein [Chitinolyticbacter meiyuanensis]|uniref:hypothetical protein n=1 Tax=Chitinolyticbacter meiyuanensis TaxID=682798 RepID=UPI003570A284
MLNLRWRSGALGSVSVSMLTYPQNLEGSITLLSERGTVRVGGVAVNALARALMSRMEFIDLKSQYRQLKADIDAAIQRVSSMDSSSSGRKSRCSKKNCPNMSGHVIASP